MITLHDSAISEGVISLRPYLSPDISGSIGVVKYPLSELIETETEPRFVAVAMGPGLDRLGPLDGCRAGIGPGHGQGDDNQQGARLGLQVARISNHYGLCDNSRCWIGWTRESHWTFPPFTGTDRYTMNVKEGWNFSPGQPKKCPVLGCPWQKNRPKCDDRHTEARES